MIVTPKNPTEWNACAQFIQFHALVAPTQDMEFVCWVTDNATKLRIVVAFNGFMGSVCQMHLAMEPGFEFSPKEMLRFCFNHAFRVKERKLVIGIVNSKNAKAMAYDLHLGFTERWRLPGMHDDGGDIVVLGMDKSQCKYLNHTYGTDMGVAA